MSAAEAHAAALAKIACALEVEEGATPGPWASERATVPAGFRSTVVYTTADESIFEDRYASMENARAIVLARALLRPAIVGAREALEQHRPAYQCREDCGAGCAACVHCATDWPCPDAARALELVSHIPEEES